MDKSKVLFILFFVLFILISVFFFSTMGSFSETVIDCETNGGQCSFNECSSIGMKDSVDGVCPERKGKFYEDKEEYCCVRNIV